LDNLNFAITVTIMGMGITFLVLILLSLMLIGMNKLWDFTGAKKSAAKVAEEKETKPAPKVEAPPAVQQETAAAPPAPKLVQGGIPGPVIAAISAALVVMSGKDARKIQITGVRHVGTAGSSGFAWARAGRNDIINTRQRYYERKGR